MKSIYLFCLLILTVSSAMAAPSAQDLFEEWGYKLTKGICARTDQSLGRLYEQSLGSAAETTLHAFMFNFRPLQNYYRNRGLSIGITRLMNTDNFHVALRECYGDDQTAKNILVWKLLVLDEVGTITGSIAGGMVGFYLFFRVAPKIFGRIWPLINRFKNKKFALAATASVIILPEIYSAWSEGKDREKEAEAEKNFVNAHLQSLQDMFVIMNETYVEYQNTKDQKQIAEIKDMATTVLSAIERFQKDGVPNSEESNQISKIKNETEKILKGVS